MSHHAFLEGIFHAGLRAASPAAALPPYLADLPEKCLVLGAGKAAAEMARVVEQHLPEVEGLVVTRHGYGQKLKRIRVMEAGHPVPDAASLRAGAALLQRAAEADRPILFLLSGGASALACAPVPGLSLMEKQNLTRRLLGAGASIDEMNCVRRHLSRIKGGGLSAVCPQPITTLAISDVVGDDPTVIGSGPTVRDHSTPFEARDICARYGLGDLPFQDTPKTAGPIPERDYRIIANGRTMISAAAEAARNSGLKVEILPEENSSDAFVTAQRHINAIMASTPGTVLLSGGELTVTPGHSPGHGGPNQHYALALAQASDRFLDSQSFQVHALAADSDGCDGPPQNGVDVAGAFVSSQTMKQARAAGLNPDAMLDAYDSGSLFKALDDQLVTGPTGTNVNDFRVIWIG